MFGKTTQRFNVDFCNRNFTGTVTRKRGDIVKMKIYESGLTHEFKNDKWYPTEPSPDLLNRICQETF